MKYRCFLCASSGHREPLWKVPQSTLPGNPPCGSVTLQGVHGLENMGKMEGTTDVQWFSRISPITFGSLWGFLHFFYEETIDFQSTLLHWSILRHLPWFSHDLPGPAGWVHSREGTSSKSLDAGGDLVNFLGDRLGKGWFNEGKWGFNGI